MSPGDDRCEHEVAGHHDAAANEGFDGHVVRSWPLRIEQ
jgi:hypothetical protein